MYYLIIAVILLVGYFALKSSRGLDSNNSGYKNLDIAEAKIMLESNQLVALDVRSPIEVKGGKINNAKVINVMDPKFHDLVNKLDKTKSYLVYCRSGNRSKRACNIMNKSGFQNLYNLSGGINAW